MSAKPCRTCGRVIVFGKDQETGQVLPLSVGRGVYRVVKNDIVMLDTKALVLHVCGEQPRPDKHFSEPEEP